MLEFQISIQIADNLLVEKVFTSSIVKVKTFLIAKANTDLFLAEKIFIYVLHTTLLMFTAWLQLDYRKILCNFCPLEFTRGPNGLLGRGDTHLHYYLPPPPSQF